MSASAAASLRRSRINPGDELSIERSDGFTRLGTFVRETEFYVTIRGTVGNDVGREILIPRDKIMQITVVSRKTSENWTDV